MNLLMLTLTSHSKTIKKYWQQWMLDNGGRGGSKKKSKVADLIVHGSKSVSAMTIQKLGGMNPFIGCKQEVIFYVNKLRYF